MSNGIQQTPQAGDPFSRAYASHGLKPSPPKAADAYQGYGFGKGRGAGCPPSPEDAITQCLYAMQDVLGETMQLAELAPWIHPSWRGQWQTRYVQAVLSVTAALDPVANAVGVALAAAASAPGFPVAVLEMGGAGDFQDLVVLTPQASQMVRLKSWGISGGNAGPKGLAVRLAAQTAGGPPSAPNPFLGGPASADQEETFALVQPDQTLKVQVGLRDLTSPTLVEFGMSFWTYPVPKRTDGSKQSAIGGGYGLECGR